MVQCRCAARLMAVLAWMAVVCAASVTTTGRRWRYEESGEVAVGTLRQTANGYPACDSVKQYSGYFDIEKQYGTHYFFWAFESRRNPAKDPVILWMTGGPGCSSGLAVLVENGPCHLDLVTGAMYNNTHSWNNAATVIYIDQPAQVGYSYTDSPDGRAHNESQVSTDMYYFMQAFYAAYPQFLENKLFVVGESYGGHYAPATAHRIWQRNNALQPGDAVIPLEGLAVGNGLTQPEVQYKYYGELAYNWCATVKGKPCISKSQYESQMQSLPPCISSIKQCQTDDLACLTANSLCSSQMTTFVSSGLNVYDIRIPCAVPGLCYNLSVVEHFFNEPAVQTALGARSGVWQSCNYNVNSDFAADWMKNFGQLVPDLLRSNIRVMLYAGDMDFICNWIGNKAWALELQWGNQTSFVAAEDRPWYVNEVPAGRVRSVSSSSVRSLFSFVQVHGAGHMVPMNQPERSLVMINAFLGDEEL